MSRLLTEQEVEFPAAPAAPAGHAAFDCDETAMHPSRPAVTRAKGSYLWLEGEAEPYLDLIHGYSTTVFGHCEDELMDAAAAALRVSDHVSGMTSPAREELSNLLAELSPVEAGRVYYDVGGAQIVSLAVRMALRVTGRPRLLALRHAFHGFSLEGEVLSETFLGGGRAVAPALDIDFIDFVEVGSPQLFGLLRSGQYAAFLIEPFQGANGLVELPREWVRAAAEECRATGTLLIADEVQVGMGRTGTFAAVERYGVRPDMITYGKALGGGVFPLSALVVAGSVYERIPAYPASAIGSTFSTSPFGCAVGAHVVRRIRGLLEQGRITELGRVIAQRLGRLVGRGGVGAVRCYGLGVTLDFDDGDAARRFVRAALAQRVFVYACGRRGNVVKLYPPYNITDAEALEIADKLEEIHAAAAGAEA
jgi:4-aminobutyrate aminotransferase-like enzyme